MVIGSLLHVGSGAVVSMLLLLVEECRHIGVIVANRTEEREPLYRCVQMCIQTRDQQAGILTRDFLKGNYRKNDKGSVGM
jgi:hypothetical protein